MKKRSIAFFLLLCLAAALLSLPVGAQSSAAVQAAVALGGMDLSDPTEAELTRGQLARLLAAFSSEREQAQSAVGSVFPDVEGTRADAGAIRTAARNNWMSGYGDGGFHPDEAVTLEQGCAAVLQLLGYDVTSLGGSFPAAQLQKAQALGLRSGITASQGQTLTLGQGAQLVYNALSAATAEGVSYGSTLGFAGADGQLDLSAVLQSGLAGPFVAGADTQLPFEPVTVYRNESLSDTAEMQAYDVYYYSASARTVWIYTRRAAGRITAVSPSASAPTSVTVAGTSYTFADPAVSAQVSSLNGGGVGQVVTLLLGMNDQVVQVLTGTEAEQVFYGVVQTASRSLDTTNGAQVLQTVTVACTDGITRSVQVDKSLNYPAGWLVEITVDAAGEEVRTLEEASLTGSFSADGSQLAGIPLAPGARLLEVTAEGLARTLTPSRLAGATLSAGDVRWYQLDETGAISQLILEDVTGDLWTYGLLDDGSNLAAALDSASAPAAEQTNSTEETSSAQTAAEVAQLLLPSAGEMFYGLLDGSIGSTLWESLASSPASLVSYGLQALADQTDGVLGSVLGYLSEGGSYVCYIDGQSTTVKTSVKYPVLTGGIALRRTSTGTVRSMAQLMPVLVDRLGAASVMSGSTRYETAEDLQVYLWYKGCYYPTTLSQVNAEDYYLVGWYDALGCAAGGRVRVLVAVQKN